MKQKKAPTYHQLSLFDNSDFEDSPATTDKSEAKEPSMQSFFDSLLKETPSDLQKETDAESNATDEKRTHTESDFNEELRLRGKRIRLRVTFDDGTELCYDKATSTLIEAINKIGVERVAALGMEANHLPLVSTEIVPRYAPWTKQIKEGWYLLAQSDTKQKYMQLRTIAEKLSINLRVEMGKFDAVELSPKKERAAEKPKQKRAKLHVTFADGCTLCDGYQKVFVAAIEHIGLDKVKKIDIKFGMKRILTPLKMYNGQTQLSSGEWLSLPRLMKDAYKMLKVISSMTHTPLELRIEE